MKHSKKVRRNREAIERPSAFERSLRLRENKSFCEASRKKKSVAGRFDCSITKQKFCPESICIL
ncbi:MAG: hypothetical protein F6K24_24440 [Okeania sp. SIO2D1]|uniref:hypothetical protein n=1 Tax=Okeania sp. SIO1I7 TaxID=2607772 RepID=UPI0013BD9141|nr:hypothetical protein [Okeania sp. SIO1I7]NES68160.1 hypothetical protein [Okeania sp. SIO2D1]NET27213.1 hypothetical protein [Okeania sp. SIO1I7]